MDKNGFFSVGLLIFIFAPLALTVAVLLGIWWKRINDSRAVLPTMDTPGLLLAATVRQMPEERREWGTAMMTELGQVQETWARWRFALDCMRVALFPPRCGVALTTSQNPVCSVLAVTLPPLGLPLLYLAALLAEALLQQEGVTMSESYPGLGRSLGLCALAVVLAGVPLGGAGLLRGERRRGLAMMGILSSLCIIGYFLVVMHFVAGGPQGD